jgi:energy-coupling factor transporter ATP-binding protein EcfA2
LRVPGEYEAHLDDFRDAELPPPTERIFLDAHDFVAQQIDRPTPLLGNASVSVIPPGGLVVIAGRPGSGKTTLALDLACHLAAGLPWPPKDAATKRAPDPWPTSRPLRVALVENEGPQEMFRSKLAEKLDRFPVDLRKAGGKLTVSTFRWGSFSFADPEIATTARAELDEDGIDLVLGDPLASLGPEGVGSPAETRAFVAQLRPLGLGTNRTFLFLHHFRERVDRTEDEMQRISGAWGGHLDTLLTLAATGSPDQARLAYRKLRWSSIREPSPIILGRIWATGGFETLGEEDDVAILEPLIYAHLTEIRARNDAKKGYATADEIRKGIGKSRSAVTKALEGAPHLFDLATGDRAKALGAKARNAKLWGLTEWVETPSLEEIEQRRLRLVEEPEPLEGEPL